MTDLWHRRRDNHERIEVEERARQQRIIRVSSIPLSPPGPPAHRPLSRRSHLGPAMIGAGGGIAGVLVWTIPFQILAILFAEAFMSGTLPQDSAEVLGYLVGTYCCIMVPCGGAIVGELPGAFVGALRDSRGHEPNPLYPLLGGMPVTLMITLGGSIGALSMFRQYTEFLFG